MYTRTPLRNYVSDLTRGAAPPLDFDGLEKLIIDSVESAASYLARRADGSFALARRVVYGYVYEGIGQASMGANLEEWVDAGQFLETWKLSEGRPPFNELVVAFEPVAKDSRGGWWQTLDHVIAPLSPPPGLSKASAIAGLTVCLGLVAIESGTPAPAYAQRTVSDLRKIYG